jgi:hypothetical protein
MGLGDRMAKKKKAPRKKPAEKPTTPTSRDEAWLEKLIALSEKQVTNQGTSIDELFTQQANRLRKELEELRKNK